MFESLICISKVESHSLFTVNKGDFLPVKMVSCFGDVNCGFIRLELEEVILIYTSLN